MGDFSNAWRFLKFLLKRFTVPIYYLLKYKAFVLPRKNQITWLKFMARLWDSKNTIFIERCWICWVNLVSGSPSFTKESESDKIKGGCVFDIERWFIDLHRLFLTSYNELMKLFGKHLWNVKPKDKINKKTYKGQHTSIGPLIIFNSRHL